MKRILSIVSIAALLAACNQENKTSTDAVQTPVVQQPAAVNADTSGLAQFREWKAQQELTASKGYQQPVRYVTTMPVKKAKKVYQQPAYSAPETTTADQSVAHVPEGVNNTERNSTHRNDTDTTGNTAMNSESSHTAKAPEKKGWSKAAKGAVIGGAGGAIAGAVINKNNRAIGAVIGGVAGAGGGYAIGRSMDKKDGRY